MLEDYMKGALLLSGLQKEHDEVKRLIKSSHRVIFLGNGGSMSSCSHMAHDFLKVGGIKTLCPESPNLITCLANDYGVENMWLEWFNIQRELNDLLIVISSSGNSTNLVNLVKHATWCNHKVVTITGFDPSNRLNQLGDVNVHLATESFGVHEQFAGIFLHSILDDIVKENQYTYSKIQTRIERFVKAGMSKSEAELKAQKFSPLSDEQFDAVAEVIIKNLLTGEEKLETLPVSGV